MHGTCNFCGNTFGLVCPVHALTFESVDLETSFNFIFKPDLDILQNI